MKGILRRIQFLQEIMLECEALHGVPAGVHQQLGGGPGAPEVPHQQDPSRGAPAAVTLPTHSYIIR